MYCKSCGKIISDDSSFCSHCGDLQTTPQTATISQQIVNHQKAQSPEGVLGIKISKQVVGFYLVWLLLQLILLLINWDASDFANEIFWPFSKNSTLEDYNLSEFLLYTLVPLIILVIVNLFKNPTGKELETIQLKYDLTYEKDAAATFIGVTLIIISLILYFGLERGNDYNYYNETDQIIRITIYVISFILRIGITFWVVNIAKELNRDTTGWGFFAFFLPSITLIIIGQKRKLKSPQQ